MGSPFFPLALMPNINGGTLSPTFYGFDPCVGPAGAYNYHYWNGSSWVNTMHTTRTGTNVAALYNYARGFGGCNGRLYDMLVPINGSNFVPIWVYDGTGPATYLTTLNHGVSICDIAVDCNCNFYVIDNDSPQNLRMYDSFGNAVCTASLNTPFPVQSPNAGKGGLAIIGNTLYLNAVNNTSNICTMQAAILGGPSITFTTLNNFVTCTTDFANCASCGSSPLPVSINTGTVNCYTPTAVISTTVNTSLNPITYSWTGPAVVGSATNAAVSVTAQGTYTCNISAGGCSPMQSPSQTVITVAVTTDTTPTLASITPTSGICPYPSAQLFSFPNTTLYASLWQGPGIVSGGNTPTLTLNTGGTYSVTVTNTANGCADTKTVSVITAPVFTLTTSSNTLCAQNFNTSPASITLTAQGGISYSLQSSSSFSSSAPNASQMPVVPLALFPSVVTTLTATVIGFDGTCSNSVSVSFSIVPNPTLTVTPQTTSICAGQSANLGASGANSYAWSPAVGLNTTTGANVTANPNLSTIYTVIGSSYGCHSASQQATLNVQALPTLTILPNSPGVCLNTTTISLTASGTGTSFTWSPSTGLSQTTGQIVQAFPTSPQNYTVIASLNTCTVNAVTMVTVVPAPTLSISLSSPSLCAQALSGSPNSITLTSGGANTYTLNTPLHITSTSPTGPIVPVSTQPPFNTGVATATLYGSNGVCTVTTTANFNVIPNPTITVTSSTPVICAGQTLTYTSYGAASYTWGPNSPNLTTYSVGDLAVANPSINSVFSVIGGSLGCFSAAKILTLTVYPLPDISVSPSSPTLCLHSPVLLQAGGTGTTFTWSPSLGLSHIFGSTVLANPTNNQQYTLTASANNCTSSAVLTVSVIPLPNALISVSKPAVCLNEEVLFTGSGGIFYNWSGPSLFDKQENPLKIKADNLFQAGTYTLTVSDQNGCRASSTASIVIYDLPKGSLKGKMEACVPFTSEYYFEKAYNASNNIVASWNIEKQNQKNPFRHYFSSAGEYTVTGYYKDTLSKCLNTEEFVIRALPKPKAGFKIDPEQPVENLDDVQFINTSQGENLRAYNWYFFNNKGLESQQKNTSYHFSDPGSYLVVMEVANAYGCKDTVIKNIEVQEDFTFYVPNAFTPNADENNDVFIPVIRGIKHYELSVFNRWGKKIFSSSDLSKGWDGSFAGEECKQDVYIWKITVSNKSGIEKSFSGEVSLLR